jgi:neopullulanase
MKSMLKFIPWLFITFQVCLAGGPPEVIKVEPPNWWANHSINPVRLLIHGKNLHKAHIESSQKDLKVERVKISETGMYIFADVLITPNARAGKYNLQIKTPDGATTVPIEIAPTLTNQPQHLTQDDVIYLIMPDRFSDGDSTNNNPPQSSGLYDRSKSRYYHGGNFQGIINHLPYLKNLGITAIWLNPIYDNNNQLNRKETYDGQPITDYHGYGATDFYGVEEHFGTLAKLQELVNAAHKLGIKVIQDQVANHTGPYHHWVKNPPTPTWYNGSESNHLANTWQTWTIMDPQSNYQMQRATLEGWFIDILPDFNQNDAEVERYIIQNTLWWIGTVGFDGIRQDTLPYVPRSFWHKWMQAIKLQYPKFKVIGELYDADPVLVSFFQGGKPRFDGIDTGIDALFDFPLFFSIRNAFAQRKPVKEVAMMLARDHLYHDSSILVTFFGLHDVQRFMNESGATIEGLKLAQTFIMTTRGIPMIYYGDEIAMPGGPDPDNRRDFPGGFPDNKRTDKENEIYEHVKQLTALRSRLEPLRRGRLVHLYTSEQQYAYARKTDRAIVLVAINNDNKPAAMEFDVSRIGLTDKTLLTDQLGISKDVEIEKSMIKVNLPARSAAIFTVK